VTPERWRQVTAIFHAALRREPELRSAYLDETCAGDSSLRSEVESLLAGHEDAGRASTSAVSPDVLPELSPGTAFGQYRIEGLVGSGGMGQVYRATDPRLHRTVAIKVLMPTLVPDAEMDARFAREARLLASLNHPNIAAIHGLETAVYKARDTRVNRVVAVKLFAGRATSDPAARERLAREARAVAALNHPHICTLYDIGSQDGLDFLVMEYLDGETLAARLERGALPIREALLYAEQIASALVEAHRAGIVHRDVKPGNIMLTRAGRNPSGSPQAKLLDFGLAKLDPLDLSSGPVAGRAAALDLTVPGFILGTAQYMAPEQVEGNAMDPRSDIFAFGAVLFEMLTGRKAFEGTCRSEVLAAILDAKRPRVSAYRREVPAEVDRLISTCLARNPGERYQSIQALLVDLRAVQQRRGATSRIRALVMASAIPVLSIAAASAWAMWAGRNAEPEAAPAVTRLVASTGVLGSAALSPDGSRVAFSWVGDGVDNPELVLLPIGSTTRTRLTHDPAAEEWPAWSPDGRQIAFIRCATGGCGIFTLPVGGGPERKVLDLRADRYNGLDWSPDGRLIAYAERPSPSEPYALFLLSIETMDRRRLTMPSSGGGEFRFAFSPDGKSLAVIRLAAGPELHIVSVATGTDTSLLSGQQEWFGGVAWSAGGRDLILSANQQGVRRLWRLPITGGPLEQLAVAGENAFYPSVSRRTGRLTFVHEFRDWDFAQLALDRRAARAAVPFSSSTRIDIDPAFSPDGRQVAFISERGGSREVWMSAANGSDATRLTSFNGAVAGKPSWSPDGRLLAFHASGIHVMDVRGGATRRVSPDGEYPTWSADGRWIYFVRNNTGRFHVWKVSRDGGPAFQAITREACVAREGPHGEVYFTAAGTDGGIWRRAPGDAREMPLIADFKWSWPGYWAVVENGIYYVTDGTDSGRRGSNHLRFFEFASRRTSTLGPLPGLLDDWVGGLTISPDRRTVLYSQRTYQTTDVMLVEHFR
jgi:serine/threonine protein kinase/Tol biopolymer transport system component